jgi:hypothetical protein
MERPRDGKTERCEVKEIDREMERQKDGKTKRWRGNEIDRET